MIYIRFIMMAFCASKPFLKNNSLLCATFWQLQIRTNQWPTKSWNQPIMFRPNYRWWLVSNLDRRACRWKQYAIFDASFQNFQKSKWHVWKFIQNSSSVFHPKVSPQNFTPKIWPWYPEHKLWWTFLLQLIWMYSVYMQFRDP